MDTWLARVLLAVLASLRFLCFGKQTLLLINAMSLRLTVVEDLNKECFFFILHSFCIFRFSQRTLTPTKMSNLSSVGSNSPKDTSSSSESALSSSDNNIPSPPPRPMHPLLPFPILPLPPQVFILEEVAPFNWSDEEKEDSEELWLKDEEDAEEAVLVAFIRAPSRRRRRCRPSQSGSESSASDPSNSRELDSSDGFDLGEDEGEEEEEKEKDDADEEEMECL